MQTRVYVQSEHFPDIKLVEIDDHATLDDLKRAALALLPAGIDASELTLSVEDDDDDAHAQAAHVKDLKKEHGIRVHIHRCKQVEVQVHFGAEVVHHKFRPATTVGRVRQWAGHKLGMQPSDIAEHVLQVTGTNDQPDVDIHIGTLAAYPACSVIFDLVPAHRING
ncbi:MAG: hypothetical protein M0P95_12110 [Sulfuritalea sp.]|jgi:hypothetical protein|nr:hypothetical protein [Sulfuritalea sp.]